MAHRHAHSQRERNAEPVVETQAAPPDPVLLTRAEVFKLLRVGRTLGYRVLRKDGFPEPFELDRGNLRWDRQEVLRYVAAQPRRSAVGVEPQQLESVRQYRNGKLVQRRSRASSTSQGGTND